MDGRMWHCEAVRLAEFTVSCELPFTTNVTISTSISQIFRSWVARFHLRQPMVLFISQLIRHARACSSNGCFILRAARLSSKLLRQGYVVERLKSSLKKFYGRYGVLIKHYEVSLSKWRHDILGHDHIQWHPQLIRHYTYLRMYYRTGFNTDVELITEFWRFPKNIATGAASQQRTLTPPDTWSCPIWDLHLFLC